MGNPERFNKKASEPESRPDDIIKALDLSPGMNIIDLGAGGGYYTLRFAELVGASGRVYAVDTDRGNLEHIQTKALEEGMDNVEVVHSSGDDIPLSEREINLVYSRNAYHHLTARVEYFHKLRRLLKPKGRVALVDYDGRGSRFSFHKLFGHYVRRDDAVSEMNEAGYKLMDEHSFLGEQFFLVFE
ncbi:MAG: class I SAM-dependent methyltransferase [Candidatus Altiarchaeota archaeon]|nr:class I SAM-dependent methyltransferase [Candidatus Altiarchaeota archaeon]